MKSKYQVGEVSNYLSFLIAKAGSDNRVVPLQIAS